MSGKSYHHGDLKNALIDAGTRLLAERGTGGLSLRAVAELAGVSHSAPYSHFSGKQGLIRAMAAAGYRQLHCELQAVVAAHPADPRGRVARAATAYLEFAQERRQLFQLMFSSPPAGSTDSSELAAVTRQLFQLLVDVVAACDPRAGVDARSRELQAVIVWGQVHGIVQLALENQISRTLLQSYTVPEILRQAVLSSLSARDRTTG